MKEAARRRVRIWVSGRVQGVSFRANAQRSAAALGLDGWARNLSDGRVELLAEGEAGKVAAFVEWCQRGPRWARVDELRLVEEAPTGEATGFHVRRDG